MIHKRNLTLTALIWAAVVTLAFWLFPRLYHGAAGWWYWPSLALSVIISHLCGGNAHSPSSQVGWSAFAVYTIFYWVIFLIIYVALLEFYLLRGVLHHLEEVRRNLTAEKPDSGKALESLGHAVAELEARRRRHLLLRRLELPDLPPEQHHLLAARAITQAGEQGPVKALWKKLAKQLAAQAGPDQAAVLLGRLKGDARALASQNPGPKAS